MTNKKLFKLITVVNIIFTILLLLSLITFTIGISEWSKPIVIISSYILYVAIAIFVLLLILYYKYK